MQNSSSRNIIIRIKNQPCSFLLYRKGEKKEVFCIFSFFTLVTKEKKKKKETKDTSFHQSPSAQVWPKYLYIYASSTSDYLTSPISSANPVQPPSPSLWHWKNESLGCSSNASPVFVYICVFMDISICISIYVIGHMSTKFLPMNN